MICRQKRYNDFICIADRCNYTCCSGWEVTVDKDTVTLWKNSLDSSEYVDKNLKSRTKGKQTEYMIRTGPGKRCPFLNATGLCDIVITHGDNTLPQTCRTFPRVVNMLGNTEEYSLSLACPVVVDMMYDMEKQMEYQIECRESQSGKGNAKNELPENQTNSGTSNELATIRIRAAMIDLFQNCNYELPDRMLLTFHMLITIREELTCTGKTSDTNRLLEEVTGTYQDQEFQAALINTWNGLEYSRLDALYEVNELFLDITQNYRKEKQYKAYLQKICQLAEEIELEDFTTEWDNFQLLFHQLDSFLENCMVSKIFSGCINEDLDDLIVNYQMVITEYAMVRYSTFLWWLQDKKAVSNKDGIRGCTDKSLKDISPYYPVIRDYIVSYSRIIGYNTEGMKEFWEESFDEAVWELGYMILLIK